MSRCQATHCTHDLIQTMDHTDRRMLNHPNLMLSKSQAAPSTEGIPPLGQRQKTPCRVLVVHNRYQILGGEEMVVTQEVELLRQHGHTVVLYERDNHDISRQNPLTTFQQTIWSRRTYQEVQNLIQQHQIDVVHIHNTLPLVSPSVYWAVHRSGAALVQTLHNFRWLCPKATMMRHGQICEQCVGRSWAWPAVAHHCYRDSAVQTAALAFTYGLHTRLGSLHHHVDRLIALTEFSREKFIAGGLPAERLVVKPNTVTDTADLNIELHHNRQGILYVGRLSDEKGPQVLVKAVQNQANLQVKIAGTGPLTSQLPHLPNVHYLGLLTRDEVRQQMSQAQVLVLPSMCYEGLPMTLLEAYASGLPIIASRIGALSHLVQHEVTGLLFEPGNPQDLAQKLHWAQEHPEQMRRMGEAARQTYLAHYTPQANYQQMLRIYQDAMAHRALRQATNTVTRS